MRSKVILYESLITTHFVPLLKIFHYLGMSSPLPILESHDSNVNPSILNKDIKSLTMPHRNVIYGITNTNNKISLKVKKKLSGARNYKGTQNQSMSRA